MAKAKWRPDVLTSAQRAILLEATRPDGVFVVGERAISAQALRRRGFLRLKVIATDDGRGRASGYQAFATDDGARAVAD